MREFYDIAQAATDEQRHLLGELIGSGFGNAPETLCDHVNYLWVGALGQLFWQASWNQVVTDVADHVGIAWLALLARRQWHELSTCRLRCIWA
jgi:hypothetical protein